MINAFLRNLYVPVAFKVLNILAFIALIAIGFSTTHDDSSILIQLRNTNLANLVVWSYWWPLIIIFAVFLGRAWCFICPVT